MGQDMGKSRPSGSPHDTSTIFSAPVGENDGRVSAPVHILRTGNTDVVAGAERHTGVAHHFSLLRVVGTASPWWLVAAVVTAAVAITSVAYDRVPLGSGVAVGMLTIAAIVDVSERRLPDVIVIGASSAFAICLALDSAIWQADLPLAGVVSGIAAFGGPLLILHLIAPASMGFGDVKTGGVLGAAVGAVDWQLALVALALAAGFTAAVGVATRVSTIAFGPGLVAASAIVMAAHPVFLAHGTADPTTAAVMSSTAAPTPAAAIANVVPDEDHRR